MTNSTQNPQDTAIKSLDISEEYKEKALKQIKSMVNGNKFNPEEVELKEFKGEILCFEAENMLTVLKKTSHKTVAGRVNGPIVVANESAAQEAMNKAYLTLSNDKDMQRKIRDVVLNREDKGFAVDNNIIPLPFWKKEFVIFKPCHSCNSSGKVRCLRCAGKGLEQCTHCNQSGMRPCTHCNGMQMIQGPNGNQIQCPMCHGRGRTSCNYCNQTGRIQCKTCRGKGTTICPNCNGNAWSSEIHIMEIEARTAFDYPKSKLPEKVVAMIEKHGSKVSKHADIKISQAEESNVNADDKEKARLQADALKKKDCLIPIIYEVYLPYAHMEYEINNNSYYSFIFGTQGKLIHVSSFIDDLIKNGIRKLDDAANLRGDVSNNLCQAAEYRTIKEGIFYGATYSLGKAKKMLKQSNRVGLSDNSINTIIKNTDLALKNITKKPRNIGLALAGGLYFIIFAAYFLSPLRQIITSNIANQNLHIICDLSILAISTYLGILTIQGVAHSAIKKIMSKIGINKSTRPKLGDKLYWNAGMAMIIFIAILEISRNISQAPPNWYINLF